MQSLWTSDARGLEKFVSIQPDYSLANPVDNDDVGTAFQMN